MIPEGRSVNRQSMATESKSACAAAKINALYSVLTIERLHGRGSVPIAILLLDSVEDRLYARFRDDLAGIADDEATEVLEGMEEAIMTRAKEEGASRLWNWFSETLSGTIRMGEPEDLPAPEDWKAAIDVLFERHVIG